MKPLDASLDPANELIAVVNLDRRLSFESLTIDQKNKYSQYLMYIRKFISIEKKIVDSWLQNSWYYRMNSIQVCVDRFVNMFLTIRFGKHILFRDPSELKFLLVHQNEIAALSSGQKIVIIAKAPWLIFLFLTVLGLNRVSRNRKMVVPDLSKKIISLWKLIFDNEYNWK